MKKTIFFLIALMALGITGCDRFHKADLSKVDLVVIQHGQMQFYNHANKKLTPYEAEKDSVINVAFDNNNQAILDGCDLAIFEDGKITFYNSNTKEFIPFVVENEYVVNGTFSGDYVFYYTVAINEELYLKRIIVADFLSYPEMLTDCDLKQSDCLNDDNVAPIFGYSNTPVVRIDYGYVEEFGEYTNTLYYDCIKGTKTDFWPNDYDVSDGADNRELQLMNDQDLFVQEDIEVEGADEDKSYYYYVPQGNKVCISDKIDFDQFKTTYSYEPQFQFLGINPNRDGVVYAAYLDWGHVGHGPLCFASLDGKVQMALDGTDASDACYGWLKDGRLASADGEGIYLVSLDGTKEKISTAQRFVTIH